MNADFNLSRVLKNTLALYFRMAVLTLISLYTVRVVLETLGVVDYGLYNVVGGCVGMFTFMSGTIANAAQRFFALSIGIGDWKKLSRSFSGFFWTNAGVALFVFLVAETVGAWFVFTEIQIPQERLTASVVVYEVSIFTFTASILTTSFQAILVADENMSVYSTIAVLEGLLKLLLVYLLQLISCDKLMLYAVLYGLSSLAVDLTYILYCRRKYPNLRLSWKVEKRTFREIASYVRWNFIGAIATVLRGQGINIIINIFFGAAVNAARAIAFQINTVMLSFAGNFMQAIEPQIYKAYAQQEEKRFSFLLTFSSKLSYFLLFYVALPFMVNADYVLSLWLVSVPPYTVLFSVWVLIDALAATVTNPLLSGVEATGKVRLYFLTVGVAALLNCPLTYAALQFVEDPLIPFWVSVFVTILLAVIRIGVSHVVFGLRVGRYCGMVLPRIFFVSGAASAVDWFFFGQAQSFAALLGNCVGSALFVGALVWFCGFSAEERKLLRQGLH